MKLYTKEMFLIAAEKCEVSMIDAKHIMQYIDEYVTPIELPTDEEVELEAKNFYWKRNPSKVIAENSRPDMVIGYVEGAKWIKEQILNQNK